MTEYVSQQQLDEFEKMLNAKLETIAAENKRQNVRIGKTEDWLDEVRQMQTTLKQQGDSIERMSKTLTEMKEKPAKQWDNAVSYTITVVISLVLGYLFNLII